MENNPSAWHGVKSQPRLHLGSAQGRTRGLEKGDSQRPAWCLHRSCFLMYFSWSYDPPCASCLPKPWGYTVKGGEEGGIKLGLWDSMAVVHSILPDLRLFVNEKRPWTFSEDSLSIRHRAVFLFISISRTILGDWC